MRRKKGLGVWGFGGLGFRGLGYRGLGLGVELLCRAAMLLIFGGPQGTSIGSP